jgi:hypothetical protein
MYTVIYTVGNNYARALDHKRHKSETSHKITRHVIDLESAE